MLPRISQVEADGHKYFVLATGDLIANHLFRHGSWDTLLQVLAKLLLENRREPTVLDIGANIGLFTVPVAKQIEDLGGRVYCYEPQRIVFQQLCANVFQNKISNVFARHRAVGDDNGTVDIPEFDYAQIPNIGAFSLSEELQKKRGLETGLDRSRAEKVDICRLDDQDLIGPVDLIKIDVEGYELKVLRGAVKLLELNDFPPILFEAWKADWYEVERKQLLEEFDGLGYQVTDLGGDNYIAQHNRFPVYIDITPKDGKLTLTRRER